MPLTTPVADQQNRTATQPAVVLAMKYSSSEGNVWAWVGSLYNRLGEELQQAGVRPIVAFPRMDPTTAFATDHLDPVERDLTREGTDKNPADAAAWLKANNVKVILYADIDPSSVDLKLMRKLGVRTINYAHYNYPETPLPSLPIRLLKQMRGRLNICHHDLYIPVSQRNLDFLHLHAGIPLEKLKLVINGIDVDRFNPGSGIGDGPSPAQWDLPVTDHYVITVCQSRPEKRVDFLIDVAADLFKRRPDASVTFVYVGAGSMLESWKAKAESLGVADRFIFLGQRYDVQALLQLGTMAAHPSEREGLCLAILEAMSSGLPMLCRDIAANRESVVHDVTGYLLSLDDASPWADKLLAMMDDTALRTRLGNAGRARVEERFSIRRQVRELRDILLEQVG